MPISLRLGLVLLLEAALFGLLRALNVLLPPERLRPLHLLLHQPVDGALLALCQPALLLLLLLLRVFVILRFLFLGTRFAPLKRKYFATTSPKLSIPSLLQVALSPDSPLFGQGC